MDKMKMLENYMGPASRDPREIIYCNMATYLTGPYYVSQSVEQGNLLIREVYGDTLVGHYGENKRTPMLKEQCYWPGMTRDV